MEHFGKRYPIRLIADLCSRCNLRCRYCCFFSNHLESTAPELSTDMWRKIFREAAECGVFNVTLRGGEALLREDFREIVDAVVKANMRFKLMTNGILLTPDMAKFIRDTGRCDQIALSIDGDEAVHDSARGRGSHAAAVKALEVMREAGLKFYVTSAVHRQNYRRVMELDKYFFEELAVPKLGLSGVSRCSEGTEWELGMSEFAHILTTIGKWEKLYPNRLEMGGLYGVLRSLRETASCKPARRGFCACSAAGSSLKVRADGVYTVCFDLEEYNFGSAKEITLAEAWRNSEEIRKHLFQGVLKREQFAECRDCEFAKSCCGACPAEVCGNPVKTALCLKKILEETNGVMP